ncbi:MAG: substrate-binding domain-containing protein [Nitrospirae bacterium]|nr:substrate-binding domain-containing protein [Nitrospirota bacterium]
MKRSAFVLAIGMVFVLAMSLAAFADEIKVGAGAAPTENFLKPVKDHFEKATGLKLTIIASGPKIALMDLEKGAVDAAAAGLTFEDWMNLMKKEGAEIKDPSSLQQATIGKDKIVVITHKDNPVSKLSKEQLKGIFTGKTSNWKDVGGKDMPIIVVWGKLIPGTNSLFIKNMLDGESQAKDILEATTADDVKQNVASNPEAIGIGPAAVVDATIKSPETPEVARPVIIVTKGAPSPKVQKLIDFIKGEGQKYIKQ